MSEPVLDDDLIEFLDEDPELVPASDPATWWKLLVVDDEPEVHKVTELALSGFAFEERRVQIVNAYSGIEARQILAEHPDTAVILLDVVMETDDAGLEFVRWVRGELGNRMVRIILRTGQPGHAPEQKVVVDYDINDYKNKAELTAGRLFTTMVSSLRSHRDLRHISEFNTALARFVPSEMTALLGRRDITEVQLGDHVERTMAVLFSDIRAFTTRSEQLSPAEVFGFLNSYLAQTGPIIRAHGGYIDKYVGDAILAIFPDGQDDALRAAIALQRQVDLLNEQTPGGDPIHVGIGVHAGPLVLGTIGEEQRMDATVIADAVNIAARLQLLCKEHGARIVTTEDCLANSADPTVYATRALGSLVVRGKVDAVPAYEVMHTIERAGVSEPASSLKASD
ncbi:MAG: adenylate/guanylate cyclase domain-containing protein [Sporichthyaceae bacterium]